MHDKIFICASLVVNTLSKDMNVDSYYKDFIADFYTYAVCDVVECWMKNRHATRMSSDELIHLFELTMLGNVKTALQRCEAETLKQSSDNKNS